jgi:hypothetical protein
MYPVFSRLDNDVEAYEDKSEYNIWGSQVGEY